MNKLCLFNLIIQRYFNDYNLKLFYTFLFLGLKERLIIKNLLISLGYTFIFFKAGLLNSIILPKKFIDTESFFLVIFTNNLNFSEISDKISLLVNGTLKFSLYYDLIYLSLKFDIKKIINYFVNINLMIFKKISNINLFFRKSLNLY